MYRQQAAARATPARARRAGGTGAAAGLHQGHPRAPAWLQLPTERGPEEPGPAGDQDPVACPERPAGAFPALPALPARRAFPALAALPGHDPRAPDAPTAAGRRPCRLRLLRAIDVTTSTSSPELRWASASTSSRAATNRSISSSPMVRGGGSLMMLTL